MQAKWMYDETDRVYFVRLYADDGSFEAICTCESMDESKIIAQCINAVANTDADRCMKASLALRKFMGIRLPNPLSDIPADIHEGE